MSLEQPETKVERIAGFGAPSVAIAFAGLAVTLDGSGAAYLAEHGALIVSDLHLEKGSNAAARGRLVPALDSHDTLVRLKAVVEAYRPGRVICLGDSFHDCAAAERMADADRAALKALCALTGEWIWIAGNHDPQPPEFCEGERLSAMEIGGVVLRHEPDAARGAPHIVGHFHPKARVGAGGAGLSGRCFCVSDDLLMMPAFGAYAGGMAWQSPALRSLHRAEPRIFMLHASKLWRLA
ncbi:MAG: ligase-associated DNA damage response endonuclease PdeM [Rhodomicrobium sp.]